MAEASLEELDELEDELADDGMLEKYRAQVSIFPSPCIKSYKG